MNSARTLPTARPFALLRQGRKRGQVQLEAILQKLVTATRGR